MVVLLTDPPPRQWWEDHEGGQSAGFCSLLSPKLSFVLSWKLFEACECCSTPSFLFSHFHLLSVCPCYLKYSSHGHKDASSGYCYQEIYQKFYKVFGFSGYLSRIMRRCSGVKITISLLACVSTITLPMAQQISWMNSSIFGLMNRSIHRQHAGINLQGSRLHKG